MPNFNNITDMESFRNFSDIELEALLVARNRGKRLGRTLSNLAETGALDLKKPLNLVLPFDEITSGTYPLARITMEFASTLSYSTTTNQAAKGFYLLSIMCSYSAILTGGTAVVSRACKISQTAAFSEAMGAGFMFLGNQAYNTALRAEGKPVPIHSRRFMKNRLGPTTYTQTYDGISFAMPGSRSSIIMSDFIEKIPFQQIGRVVGVAIAVYGYGKIIIVGYRYAQQLVSKYQYNLKEKRKKSNSKLVKTQALCLIVLSNRLDSIQKRKSIYSPLFV